MGCQSFFLGSPKGRGGGGATRKIRAKFFRDPKKLKFPQVSSMRLRLEGARRVFFKVTMHISADMGGICVNLYNGQNGYQLPLSFSAAGWFLAQDRVYCLI